MAVRLRSSSPSSSAWHQGMSASAFCRSTSALDVAAPRCIRASTHRDRPAARRLNDTPFCGTRYGRTRSVRFYGSVRRCRWSAGFWFCARVVDVLDRKIELVLVPLRIAAVLAAAIGQYAQQFDVIALEQRDHTIVEEISCRNRRLAIVELGAGNLGVGIDEGLLVDAMFTILANLPSLTA